MASTTVNSDETAPARVKGASSRAVSGFNLFVRRFDLNQLLSFQEELVEPLRSEWTGRLVDLQQHLNPTEDKRKNLYAANRVKGAAYRLFRQYFPEKYEALKTEAKIAKEGGTSVDDLFPKAKRVFARMAKGLQRQETGVVCFIWKNDVIGLISNPRGKSLLEQAGQIGFDVHRVMQNACESKFLRDAAKALDGNFLAKMTIKQLRTHAHSVLSGMFARVVEEQNLPRGTKLVLEPEFGVHGGTMRIVGFPVGVPKKLALWNRKQLEELLERRSQLRMQFTPDELPVADISRCDLMDEDEDEEVQLSFRSPPELASPVVSTPRRPRKRARR